MHCSEGRSDRVGRAGTRSRLHLQLSWATLPGTARLVTARLQLGALHALEHVFNQQLVSGQVLGSIFENEVESWSIGCGGDGGKKILHGLQVNIYFVPGILPDSALCTFLP